MVRPKQTDRNAIRADFYNYNGSLKQFCEDRGLEYAGISVWLKARDRERFHKQVMQTAQSQMVTRASGDIVERLEKHWELTNIIEAKILQKLQEDAAEPKSLEQLLRVLQENVRLQRLILGEPNLITQTGPKSPYESFLNKLDQEGITEAEVVEDGKSDDTGGIGGASGDEHGDHPEGGGD
tara:strand:+ start:872 stop:1414 length:543 start_codon:yes stop_codon:yes gene_type:complete